VKKKGRPTTQCESCRNLRQRKHHVKCACGGKSGGESSKASEDIAGANEPASTSSRQAKRRAPSTPTLPNGLRDVLRARAAESSTSPQHPKQRVNELLNPCDCGRSGCCGCYISSDTLGRTRYKSTSRESPSLMEMSDRQESPTGDSTDIDTASQSAANEPSTRSCCMPTSDSTMYASDPSSLYGPRTTSSFKNNGGILAREPSLNIPSYSPSPSSDPEPLRLPPMPTLALHPPSAIDYGCHCGPECSCDARLQHSNDAMVLDAASTGNSGLCCGRSGSPTQIEKLITSLAAAIPPPPENLRISLDPSDISVYPRALLVNPKAARIAGLVTVPRLVCCGGSCRCLSGQCRCGEECNGSCGSHNSKSISKPA